VCSEGKEVYWRKSMALMRLHGLSSTSSVRLGKVSAAGVYELGVSSVVVRWRMRRAVDASDELEISSVQESSAHRKRKPSFPNSPRRKDPP
jgi:hypothetical protein